MATFDYDVFISYSRKDISLVEKLEARLRRYRPPRGLRLSRQHLRVFRDTSDLRGTEYEKAIKQFLDRSAKLLVICSPNSRKSQYVQGEIRYFASIRKPADIIPVLAFGLPNSEAGASADSEKAFPDALCTVLQDPLASDFRQFDSARHRIGVGHYREPFLKLLADLYDIDRRVLEEREKVRQRKAIAAFSSPFALALIVVVIWLGYTRTDHYQLSAIYSAASQFPVFRGDIETAWLAIVAADKGPSKAMERLASLSAEERQPILADTAILLAKGGFEAEARVLVDSLLPASIEMPSGPPPPPLLDEEEKNSKEKVVEVQTSSPPSKPSSYRRDLEVRFDVLAQLAITLLTNYYNPERATNAAREAMDLYLAGHTGANGKEDDVAKMAAALAAKGNVKEAVEYISAIQRPELRMRAFATVVDTIPRPAVGNVASLCNSAYQFVKTNQQSSDGFYASVVTCFLRAGLLDAAREVAVVGIQAMERGYFPDVARTAVQAGVIDETLEAAQKQAAGLAQTVVAIIQALPDAERARIPIIARQTVLSLQASGDQYCQRICDVIGALVKAGFVDEATSELPQPGDSGDRFGHYSSTLKLIERARVQTILRDSAQEKGDLAQAERFIALFEVNAVHQVPEELQSLVLAYSRRGDWGSVHRLAEKFVLLPPDVLVRAARGARESGHIAAYHHIMEYATKKFQTDLFSDGGQFSFYLSDITGFIVSLHQNGFKTEAKNMINVAFVVISKRDQLMRAFGYQMLATTSHTVDDEQLLSLALESAVDAADERRLDRSDVIFSTLSILQSRTGRLRDARLSAEKVASSADKLQLFSALLVDESLRRKGRLSQLAELVPARAARASVQFYNIYGH